MRAIILAIILVLVYSGSIYAFELTITPKVAIGLSYMSGIDEPRIREGFTGGLSLGFYFVDPFSLDVGLLFQMKGTKGRNLNYHHGYMAVPITARVRVIEHFSFLAGVQTNFLLYAKTGGTVVTEHSNLVSVDIVFGASYYFFIRGGKLVFEFVVEVGVTDLTADSHPFLGGVNSNRSAYISIGWQFSLF